MGYDITAPFYDVLADESHANVDGQIAAQLRGLEACDGPIIDLGAGTGLTTRLIAAALPEARILAVEPHPAMRAALMTRICSSHDLRRRVSVLPQPIFQAPLPPVVAGIVASASLVHFDAEERQRLWALLAARLAPRGRIIVEIQCPEAIDLPQQRMATARVGQIDYEGYAEARRIDGERQLWRMTYRSSLAGTELERQSTEYLCHAVSARQVVSEGVRAGFRGEIVGDLVCLDKT